MLQIEKRETESVFRFLIWCFDIVCVPTFAVGIPYFRPWRNVGASNFVLSASHITLRVIRLPLLVDTRFQVYFIALTGLLFTFPSRYLFTIDLYKYLALAVSSASFLQACHVPKYSRSRTRDVGFSPTGLLPSVTVLSSTFG